MHQSKQLFIKISDN